MSFESLILAFMLWTDPTVKHAMTEDPSARLERLQSIASDIATVCTDPNEAPVFEGSDAVAKTCLMLASIAYNESGYQQSIDIGDKRGDSGRSVCIMQVQTGQKGQVNYTAEELKDRKTCLRAGLRILRFSKCNSGSDLNTMLRGYVSGRCEVNDDPKKEKSIAAAAANDARAYVNFIKQFKHLLGKVEKVEDKKQSSDDTKDLSSLNLSLGDGC